MATTLARTYRTRTGVRGRTLRILRRRHQVATDSESPAVATTFDEFGQRLYLFACVLTDDAELAEQLVMQTVIAHQHGPHTVQDLSAGVYIAWVAWGNPPLLALTPPSTGDSKSALVLHKIYGLRADQRAALGLCKYGAHTYRQAAEVLGLAPEHVAQLLCDALRAMAAPPVLQSQPLPAV